MFHLEKTGLVNTCIYYTLNIMLLLQCTICNWYEVEGTGAPAEHTGIDGHSAVHTIWQMSHICHGVALDMKKKEAVEDQ